MNFDAPENFAIKIVTDSEILELCPLEILEHFYGMQVVEPTDSNPIRLYKPICLKRVVENTNHNLIDFTNIVPHHKTESLLLLNSFLIDFSLANTLLELIFLEH